MGNGLCAKGNMQLALARDNLILKYVMLARCPLHIAYYFRALSFQLFL